MGDKRDKMHPESGQALDSNDQLFDVTEWRRNSYGTTEAITPERGAMPVVQSDVINRLQMQEFQKGKGSETLAADAVVDTYTVTLSAGHSAAIGDTLVLFEQQVVGEPFLYEGMILGVLGDVLTLDRPLNFSYTSAGTFAILTETEMAVDGSVTRQIYRVQPPTFYSFDITRMTISMVMGTQGDDALFGDLTALTNGITVRLVRDYENEYFNMANWKDNGHIAETCYDMVYTERSGGGGSYGMRARWTFGGTQNMGAVVRLRGGSNPVLGPQDRIEIVISDDLRGLSHMGALVQGHWVDVVWNGDY